MPEGHTIHRIARDHSRLLGGRQVRVSSPQGRFDADARRVDGAVLEGIEAYGKHLFYRWATGDVGHVHLGLFGRFRVHQGPQPPEPVGEVRMRLSSDAGTVDLSGPTACSLGTEDDRDAIVRRLGPDPLRRDADPDRAIATMRRSRSALGALLLDQSVVCGVGNVYRAEALFVTGIHPTRPGRDTDEVELRAVWDTVAAMLRQGVRDNRIVTLAPEDRPRRAPGQRARRGDTTYVYHRDVCLRCGSGTGTVTLGGRPCWFCPTCQPR